MIQNCLHPHKYRNKFKTGSLEQPSVKDLCSTEMAGGGEHYLCCRVQGQVEEATLAASHRGVMSCLAGRSHSVKICFVQKYKVTHGETDNGSNTF